MQKKSSFGGEVTHQEWNQVTIKKAELPYSRQPGYLKKIRSFPSLSHGRFGFIFYRVLSLEHRYYAMTLRRVRQESMPNVIKRSLRFPPRIKNRSYQGKRRLREIVKNPFVKVTSSMPQKRLLSMKHVPCRLSTHSVLKRF